MEDRARVSDMIFELYDYVDSKEVNEFKDWTQSLQKNDRAKLNAKLDMLKKLGPDLFPQVLTGTPTSGIQKLRVRGNVQLRPMLCPGPISIDKEFTLLLGAKEVQSKLVPKDADKIANKRKSEVLNDPKRRVKHERIS